MTVGMAVGMTVGMTVGVAVRQRLLWNLVAARQEAGHHLQHLAGLWLRLGRHAHAVRLHVEVREQEEEQDRVASDPPDEHFRVVAVAEAELEGMEEDHDKLDDLHGGEVLLPPDVLLVLRSHGS